MWQRVGQRTYMAEFEEKFCFVGRFRRVGHKIEVSSPFVSNSNDGCVSRESQVSGRDEKLPGRYIVYCSVLSVFILPLVPDSA